MRRALPWALAALGTALGVAGIVVLWTANALPRNWAAYSPLRPGLGGRLLGRRSTLQWAVAGRKSLLTGECARHHGVTPRRVASGVFHRARHRRVTERHRPVPR